MASTYSTNLAFELIGTGDQSGTWGTTTNTNLGTLIEQAISGYVQYTASGGTDTITIPNGASGVARNMYIEFIGAGGGTVLVPANRKLYFVYNNTTSPASAITVKVSGQTGISVPAGAKMCLVCNGTDIFVAENYFASLTLGSALSVASGGTGGTSITANSVILGNGTGALGGNLVAPGTAGNFLTSNGTTWTSAAFSSFSGTATLASGSTISDGTTAFNIGYLNVPQNAQSSNYTLALTDTGKHIYSTNSGAQTITIPANASVAFPKGAALTIVNNGTTAITVSASAVTLYQAGTTNTGNRTLATKGVATLLKVDTDTWFISGSGVS
jgi:hypothetical protein